MEDNKDSSPSPNPGLVQPDAQTVKPTPVVGSNETPPKVITPTQAPAPDDPPTPTVISPTNTGEIIKDPVGASVINPSFPNMSGGATPPKVEHGAIVSQLGANDANLSSKNKKLKVTIISVVILVLIVGGAAAFYFLYWMSPSVIWKQALGNSNKAYSSLVSTLNTKAQTSYKGIKLTGSLDVKGNGATYTGSINEQSDGSNSTASIKAGIGVANLDFEARTIKQATADSPDIYFQLSGFKGLGLGSEIGTTDQSLDSLDGQWIEVDHTIIDSLRSSLMSSSAATTNKPKLTEQDLVAAAQTLGTINAKYLFTTDQSNSVTTIVKKIGFETLNGKKTYHYKVGFVKQNVKNYITAIKDGLTNTALGKWATAETGQSVEDLMGYTSLESSADGINSSDTVDVWAYNSPRIIYKFRISDSSNPALNYLDLGFNYAGSKSTSFPYFLYFSSNTGGSTSVVSLVTTLDSAANSINTTITANAGTTFKINSSLSLQPSNATLSETAPAGAISLQDALGKIGLADQYNALISALSSSAQSATPGSTASGSALNSVLENL